MSKPTDTSRFIEDLDGGVLAERLGTILSHAALAVTNNPSKKGKVAIELNISNIGKGSQVQVAHKLSFKVPTAHGDTAENHTTETVLYVNDGGELTLEPKNQMDFVGHAHRNHKEQNA